MLKRDLFLGIYKQYVNYGPGNRYVASGNKSLPGAPFIIMV